MENGKEDIFDTFPHIKVKDPLSEVTRKERRSLLAVSLVALVIVKVGLLPEEITTLGIKFAAHDKGRLIILFVFIISFYLAAFMIYALSDFIAWRLAFIAERKKIFKESRETLIKESVVLEKDLQISILENKWDSVSTTTSRIRAIFEFVVPIAIAIYSIIILLNFNIQ
jgi:hypothetical protein